jgi:hypothetical protein
MHVKALERFARWFASAAGVWQTAIFTGGLILTENLDHSLDPHGFWLLYWLTAYSAVTQPVLAYVNKQDTTRSDEVLDEILDDVEVLAHPTPSKEN